MSILDRWACFIRVSVNSIGQKFKLSNIVASQFGGDLILAIVDNMKVETAYGISRDFTYQSKKIIAFIYMKNQINRKCLPDSSASNELKRSSILAFRSALAVFVSEEA